MSSDTIQNVDCDMPIEDNEITIKSLTAACKSEAGLGDLFISYNTVAISTETGVELIPTYVYCNKYYYYYDENKGIWKDIESDFMISIIEKWTRQQYVKLARTTKEKDVEKIAKLSKSIEKVLKFKYLENVLKMLKVNIHDDTFFDKLDRVRPDYLPIKDNRVINLQTGKIRTRQINDYFSFECPVEPVKKLSKFFMDTIGSIMCGNEDNIKYFQKMMGYCLTGSKEAQSYFIWYGKGSNGKSLILNLLKAVLGKACDPVAKSVLMDVGRKGNNGPEVVSLKDLRLGTFSETNAQEALNESMLKMVSGADKIKARGLYKDEISFELFLKLIICTNHKPEFNGGDFGTVRRIKFLPFDAKFTKTPKKEKEYPIIENLEEKLIKEYLNEFFTFCLFGAQDWYTDKTFQIIPKDVKAQQDAYVKEQNTFGGWFEDRIVKGTRLYRSSAYKDYVTYCDNIGTKPLSKKEIFQKLNEECGKETKYCGDMVYNGFEFKKDEGDHDEGLDAGLDQ